MERGFPTDVLGSADAGVAGMLDSCSADAGLAGMLDVATASIFVTAAAAGMLDSCNAVKHINIYVRS